VDRLNRFTSKLRKFVLRKWTSLIIFSIYQIVAQTSTEFEDDFQTSEVSWNKKMMKKFLILLKNNSMTFLSEHRGVSTSFLTFSENVSWRILGNRARTSFRPSIPDPWDLLEAWTNDANFLIPFSNCFVHVNLFETIRKYGFTCKA